MNRRGEKASPHLQPGVDADPPGADVCAQPLDPLQQRPLKRAHHVRSLTRSPRPQQLPKGHRAQGALARCAGADVRRGREHHRAANLRVEKLPSDGILAQRNAVRRFCKVCDVVRQLRGARQPLAAGALERHGARGQPVAEEGHHLRLEGAAAVC